MNDSVAVEVLQTIYKLKSKILNFKFMQAFPPFKQVAHGLIWAQLKEDINALWVFEKVFEAYDVLVLDGTMDFDLRHQFLLRS